MGTRQSIQAGAQANTRVEQLNHKANEERFLYHVCRAFEEARQDYELPQHVFTPDPIAYVIGLVMGFVTGLILKLG